jgi:hypothetical protein
MADGAAAEAATAAAVVTEAAEAASSMVGAAEEATHTAAEEDTNTAAAAADISTEEAAAATPCGTVCRLDTGPPTGMWFCARTTTSERARTQPTTAKCPQGKWLNTSAERAKRMAKFAKTRTRLLITNRAILLSLNSLPVHHFLV